MVSFFGQWLRRGRSPVQHNGANLPSCYVTSRYVTSRYVTSRYVTSRYIMLCYITSPPWPTPTNLPSCHVRAAAPGPLPPLAMACVVQDCVLFGAATLLTFDTGQGYRCPIPLRLSINHVVLEFYSSI